MHQGVHLIYILFLKVCNEFLSSVAIRLFCRARKTLGIVGFVQLHDFFNVLLRIVRIINLSVGVF